jgi:Tfp pilus assembly protein PilZ
MGLALNISQNGLQIETDSRINTEYILLMFFDYQSNYVATRGKVVYSNPVEPGKYRTGIQLTGVNGNDRKFVKRLIQSYHYQKKVPIFIS